MSLNKISYESLGLFISSGISGSYSGDQGFSLINTIQDASFDFSINRQNIKQIATSPGDSFVARQVLNAPDVNVNFSYLANTGFLNEKKLGFYIGDDNSIFKNYSPQSSDDKNIAFVVANEDNNTELFYSSNYTGYDVLSVGNAYLTNYSIEASVRSLTTVSTTYTASNVEYSKYNEDTKLPAVNLISGNQENRNQLTITDTGSNDITYFRSNEISLELENTDFGAEFSGGHIQSFRIDLPIERNDLYGFGSNYVRNRKIKFPIMASANVSLVAHEFNTGNLFNIFNQDSEYNFNISIFNDTSMTTKYKISSAKMTSQNFSSSIGGFSNVDINFEFPVNRSEGLRFTLS